MRAAGPSAGSGGRSVSSGHDAERDERELHPRLAARLQRGEVAVDVARDVVGRDRLGAPSTSTSASATSPRNAIGFR